MLIHLIVVFRDSSAHSRQLRGSWYVVGLSDKAAFYNVLANARLYQLRQSTGAYVQEDDSLGLSIENKAIRSMMEKLKDSNYHASDEMIGSVCAFMCHHVRVYPTLLFQAYRYSTFWVLSRVGSTIVTL